MDRVRLGVIGCGVTGRNHLGVAEDIPQIESVAVADVREEAAREAAQEFGIEAVYDTGEALLDDPNVDAVVIAMPTAARTRLALRAFERRKHVLTEKPVAMNAQEVEEMIQARGDLVAACCSSRYRFTESAAAATRFIASGVLGDLRVVHCRVIRSAGKAPEKTPPAWRLTRSLNGGGILVNWGCYDLDYLLGLTGWSLKPKVVLAQTWGVPPQLASHVAPGSDAEAHFAALVRCEGGAVITFDRGEYMAARAEAAWQMIGTKGSLRLTMTACEGKKLFHDETSDEEGVVSNAIWEGDETHHAVRLGPMQDFVAAILEKREPKTSLEKALVVQKITDAVYASAECGTAVEIK